MPMLKSFIFCFTVIFFIMASTLAWAQNPMPVNSFRDCPDCPQMVTIPAGTFQMGVSAGDLKRLDEFGNRFLNSEPYSGQPQHIVTISHPFALGKYPITRGEFAKFARETGFAGRTPCTIRTGRYFGPNSTANWDHPGIVQRDDEPVVCVTWQDAQAYIDWLNSKTRSMGHGVNQGPYRLPTEAEYEYAARAGTTTTRWWGDAIGVAKAHCGGCGTPFPGDKTASIGGYPPNPFGLYDILGNIWEWTQDCWSKNYKNANSDGSAQRDGDCGYRVIRAGSWLTAPFLVTSAGRSKEDYRGSAYFIGFRVAKS